MKSKLSDDATAAVQHRQRGSALLMVLVAVVVVGLVAGIAGQSWRSLMQRAREAELLWRGEQYRQAISQYYLVKQGPRNTYPVKLEDLLKDPRFLQPVRHLRQLYNDPMTGGEWEIIKAPGGGVAGVRSTSRLEPFQKDGFPTELESFKGKDSYSQWEFVFLPTKTTTRTANPAAAQTKAE
jgi:type II secretory pathway pseudopilin PulG